MRHIHIFFKISNCWFTHFVRSVNMKLFCKRANQNKNNFRFTTLTKHVNNQTNCRIALEKIVENMVLSHIHLAVLLKKTIKRKARLPPEGWSKNNNVWPKYVFVHCWRCFINNCVNVWISWKYFVHCGSDQKYQFWKWQF